MRKKEPIPKARKVTKKYSAKNTMMTFKAIPVCQYDDLKYCFHSSRKK
jgi:hypothetical protein